MTVKELEELRAKAIEDARAITEVALKDDRGLTDEEKTTYDEHIARYDELDKRLKQLDELEKREAAIAISTVPIAVPDDPSDPPKVPATPTVRANPWSSFGEQLLAIRSASLPGGVVDRRLHELRAASGSNEAIGSDGGFLVQTDYHAEVMKRVYETSAIYSRCYRLPIGPNSNSLTINGIDESSRADGSRFGGVQGYWMSEAGTKTASKPKLRKIQLVLKKLACLWYATDELLEDATAMQSVAGDAFGQEIAFMSEDSIINGTGAGMPLGIMNAPCLVTVDAEVGQAAATIQAENIIHMWSRLWARSQQNSVWLINQDVFPQLYTMGITVGTGGSPIYAPPGGLSQSPYSTLMGRPVIPVEYCATLGTTGDIILADLGEYVLAEKGGVAAASSIHVQFVYDETVYRWVLRIDGQPKWNNALTPYKGSSTVSPFVALATRA